MVRRLMPFTDTPPKWRPVKALTLRDLGRLRDEMRIAFEHAHAELERLEEAILAVQIKQRGDSRSRVCSVGQ